jgi:hypothetical protein
MFAAASRAMDRARSFNRQPQAYVLKLHVSSLSIENEPLCDDFPNPTR